MDRLFLAICDDDKLQRGQLFSVLENMRFERFQEAVIGCFQSGEELIDAIKRNINLFKVIIIKIEMESMNGILTAQRLREHGCCAEIILRSPCKDYALQGYGVGACGYLLTDQPWEDVEKAVLQAVDRTGKRAEEFCVFNTESSIKKFFLDEILYFETCKKSVIMHTLHEREIIRSKLGQIQCQLASRGFAYCHKGIVVNTRLIRAIHEDTLILENQVRLPLSRRKHSELKKAFFCTAP